jgi:hypothetical protein
MGNYTNVPILAATMATSLNNRRSGFRYVSPSHDDFRSLWILALILAAFFCVIFAESVTAVDTKTVISVKVVSAVHIKPSKSSQRYVQMTLMDAKGNQWDSSDTIRVESCPAVRYNVVKPVWLHAHTGFLGTSHRTSGMITFCEGSK